MSTDSQHVLVAGASGKTGREILRELRGTDATVRAATTSPEKTGALRRLGADEVIVGDLLEPTDARRAVDDADAILCAVGTRPSIGALYGPLVDGEGVSNLIAAAREGDVERFVYESAIGVGDSREAMSPLIRLAIYRPLKAKEHAEEHLRTSGLIYTILRPGRLTNDPPTGDVVVSEGGTIRPGKIPRADVARLMVASLFTPASENQTFEIVSKEGLRGTPTGVIEIDWRFPGATPATV